jgi:two-component system, chemotaxis family, protein-glutamate methylesterase/glutaminase
MATRVLIVEDSPFMQRLLAALIGEADDLKVVGVARDPIEARERIKALAPDVITLDVEMPRMDGITFLERLMRLRPMPVVMVSAWTEANAEITLKSLELGAVDFVAKPRGDAGRDLNDFGASLIEKLRAAAVAEMHSAPHAAAPGPAAGGAFRPGTVVAVGASTGGTEAIRELLERLPADSPPVVIVQHMPEMFTRLFARRLDEQCALKVTEAGDGEVLRPGHAYVAPGNWHLSVVGGKRQLETRLDQADTVNRHRPSVDVLFRSVAKAAGNRAAGVLLTGMGRDGADGLGEMKRAGAATFVQDRASCVVYGMPKAAIEAGYADHVGTVESLAARLVQSLRAEGNLQARDVIG